MKQMMFVLAVLFLITACKKETNAPTTTLNETVDTAAVLKFKGNFTNGPYGTVMGDAEVYKKGDVFTVRLTNFTSNNGPALHVYLSKEAMPVNYIDLGALKSTNGNQVYEVTGMPAFSDYKYVSIHCVAYNHLFGSALLK